jgi:hypothetical protein
VPNILLQNGKLIIDPIRSLPGDILHEAGHLAIFPKRLRKYCSNNTISYGDEMDRVLKEHNIDPTEDEENALMYCYDDQAPQAWQFAANIHLNLPSDTGFGIRFAEGSGKDVHDSIQVSIGHPLGHRTSVSLYYLKMIESKQAFPKMLRWTNL